MKPVSIFISYAHEDEAYRTELVSHLRPLERLGLIQSWHDRKIQPGPRWADVIDQQLTQADVVLCLVSPSFFESGYCWAREMTTALARHNDGRTRVIPALVRPVVWERTPLAALQGLPPGMIAISSHRDRDAAWKSVAEGVLEAAHGVVGLRQRIAEASH